MTIHDDVIPWRVVRDLEHQWRTVRWHRRKVAVVAERLHRRAEHGVDQTVGGACCVERDGDRLEQQRTDPSRVAFVERGQLRVVTEPATRLVDDGDLVLDLLACDSEVAWVVDHDHRRGAEGRELRNRRRIAHDAPDEARLASVTTREPGSAG